MSVSIDTVYQRVLAIANKEQRGYITPEEFNLLANQAQLDIFEQYYYDINQFSRLQGNDTEYSDMLTVLNEKLRYFETTGAVTSGSTLPTNLYRLGTVLYNGIEAERLTKIEHIRRNKSKLARATDTRPVYVNNDNSIIVYGTTALSTGVTCNYIKVPAKVEWAYRIVYGESLYSSTSSVDFELHESEETDLVYAILKLAGLIIKDPSIYPIAAGEEANDTNQEKA